MNRDIEAMGLPSGYKLIRKLGSGGMGSVYLVTPPGKASSPMILKCLRGHDIAAVNRERLKIEFQTLARLNHPNIGAVYDFVDLGNSEAEPMIFFTGEFVEGCSLNELKPPHALEAREWLDILIQATRALQYIHINGLIHYDVKPSNIMIHRDSEGSLIVKLIDFGLAREKHVALGPVIRGSIPYVAPEIIRGIQPDHRADLYSLGLTFYEVLVGKHPFESNDPLAMLRSHLETVPEPLRVIRPDLPSVLYSIVERLIEKDRERRFPSANAVIQEINEKTDSEYPIESSNITYQSRQATQLIGRDKALHQLQSMIAKKESGACLISGPAGIGKTRFLMECKICAQLSGYRAFEVSCASTDHSPASLIYQMVRSAADGEKAGQIMDNSKIDLVGDSHLRLTIPDPDLDIRSRQRIILSEICHTILDFAEMWPMVLCFEDIHKAGEATLTFLSHLVRTRYIRMRSAKRTVSDSNVALIILMSYRDPGNNTPVNDAIAHWRQLDDTMRKIVLEPLAQADTGRLIDALLGTVHDRDKVIGRVHYLTGGNPLFIQETIGQYIRRNVLKFNRGVWIFNARSHEGRSRAMQLEGLVMESLAHMDTDSRHVLDVLSVFQRCIRLDRLQIVSGIPLHQLVPLMDQLCRLGYVDRRFESGVSRFCLANPTISGALYQLMDATKRQQLHTAAAVDIENRRTQDSGSNIAELATHYYHAGDTPKALEYCSRAADFLMDVYQMDDAIGFLRWAIELTSESALKKQRQLEMKLVQALRDTGRKQAADTLWRKLYQDRANHNPEDIKTIFEFHAMARIEHGDFAEAERVLTEARSWIKKHGRPEDLIPMETVYLNMLRLKGDLSQAQDFMKEKLQQFEKLDPQPAALAGFYNASVELIITELTVNDPHLIDRAEKIIRNALEIYESNGNKSGEIRCYNKLGIIQSHRHDIAGARESYLKAAQISHQIGDRLSEATCMSNIPEDFSTERYETSISRFIQLLDAADEADVDLIRAPALLNIGANNAHRSNIDIAVQCITRAIAILRRGGFRGRVARTLYSLAIAYEIVCDFDNALKYYRQCRDLYHDLGTLPHELYASVAVANILCRQFRLEASERKAEELIRTAEKEGLDTIAFHGREVLEEVYKIRGLDNDRQRMISEMREYKTRETGSETPPWSIMLYEIAWSHTMAEYGLCMEKMQTLESLTPDVSILDKYIQFAMLIPAYLNFGLIEKARECLSAEYEYINTVYPNSLALTARHTYHCAQLAAVEGRMDHCLADIEKALVLSRQAGDYRLMASLYLDRAEITLTSPVLSNVPVTNDLNEAGRLAETYGMQDLEIRYWLCQSLKQLTDQPTMQDRPEGQSRTVDLSPVGNALDRAQSLAGPEQRPELCLYRHILLSEYYHKSANREKRNHHVQIMAALLDRIVTSVPKDLQISFLEVRIRHMYLLRMVSIIEAVHQEAPDISEGLKCLKGFQSALKYIRAVTPGMGSDHCMQGDGPIQPLKPLDELTRLTEDNDTGSAQQFALKVLNILIDVTGADRAVLLQCHPNKKSDVFKVLQVRPEEGSENRFYSLSVPIQAVESGRLVHKTWLFGESVSSELTDSMNDIGVLSAMAIPVMDRESAWGAVYLDSRSVMNGFSPADRDKVLALTAHLAARL